MKRFGEGEAAERSFVDWLDQMATKRHSSSLGIGKAEP